jgi:hypothetical protein
MNTDGRYQRFSDELLDVARNQGLPVNERAKAYLTLLQENQNVGRGQALAMEAKKLFN